MCPRGMISFRSVAADVLGIDTAGLRRAHRELAALARSGGFGQPPPGEWDAAHLLAHVAATDAAIASAALAVLAGQRPAHDNRASLDEWNPQRIVGRASGLSGLADLVSEHGELLCSVAERLGREELETAVPVLIISAGQVVVDEPRSLRSLIEGVSRVHLPRHTRQLDGLRAAGPAGGGGAR